MTNKLDIVVVGGGTAGWMSALCIESILPNVSITVVESSDIGILGAGEGTTPHFISFLDSVGIPLSTLMQRTNSTIKNGIKFTNWNNDKKSYYHGFGLKTPYLGNFSVNPPSRSFDVPSMMQIARDVEPSNFDFISLMCEQNRVPHEKNPKYKSLIKVNPIFHFIQHANFAVHFDASQIAALLKETALERGVQCIDAKVIEIVSEEKGGDINFLVLDNGERLKTDFVFDCTGFARLIIGKHFNSKWISYKEHLPVDSALPFFLDVQEPIPPYTEAIAMKYGWIWKIPLQNRYGCGYVFDSSLTTEEEVKKEIEEFVGFSPKYPRETKGVFKFEAGCYETPWVKNCIAVGLSSGFIEPLEATSIYTSIETLVRALEDRFFIEKRDENFIERYNKEIVDFTTQVFYFVYFHYMSDRNDTKFWEKFKDLNHAPEYVRDLLNLWNNFPPRKSDFVFGHPFIYENWLVVGYGINKINVDLVKQTVDNNNYHNLYETELHNLLSRCNDAVTRCLSHDELLKVLKDETI